MKRLFLKIIIAVLPFLALNHLYVLAEFGRWSVDGQNDIAHYGRLRPGVQIANTGSSHGGAILFSNFPGLRTFRFSMPSQPLVYDRGIMREYIGRMDEGGVLLVLVSYGEVDGVPSAQLMADIKPRYYRFLSPRNVAGWDIFECIKHRVFPICAAKAPLKKIRAALEKQRADRARVHTATAQTANAADSHAETAQTTGAAGAPTETAQNTGTAGASVTTAPVLARPRITTRKSAATPPPPQRTLADFSAEELERTFAHTTDSWAALFPSDGEAGMAYNMGIILDIIALCRAHAVMPVLLTTPLPVETNAAYDKTGFLATFDGFKRRVLAEWERTGTPAAECIWLDYSRDARFSARHDYFVDGNHLTNRAAVIFTDAVMDDLRTLGIVEF